jgi:hypothetical protein
VRELKDISLTFAGKAKKPANSADIQRDGKTRLIRH